MKFTLVDDWVKVLKKAWSVKFAALSAVASALEVGLPFFTDVVPAGVFAKLAALSAVLTIVSRVVSQMGMHDEKS